MPRLDRILKDRGLSSSQARDALRWGKVFVDGVPTALGGRAVTADRVRFDPEAPRIRPGRDAAFLHVDEHLVVAWKPAGLLSVPAPRRGGHQSLLGLIHRAYGAAFAVHRLDEPTSGVMLVARTEAAQHGLKAQLFEHTVERRYLAIVRGRLRSGEQRIESVFVRDRGDGLRGSAPPDASPEDGKRAVTWVKPIEDVGRRASLVEARLETGRTHQVRIHLAEQSCPVLGDPLYASPAVRSAAPRLALHAAVLGFKHPLSGVPMRFSVPLADDLEVLRQGLLADDRDELRSGGGRGRGGRGKGGRGKGGRRRR